MSAEPEIDVTIVGIYQRSSLILPKLTLAAAKKLILSAKTLEQRLTKLLKNSCERTAIVPTAQRPPLAMPPHRFLHKSDCSRSKMRGRDKTLRAMRTPITYISDLDCGVQEQVSRTPFFVEFCERAFGATPNGKRLRDETGFRGVALKKTHIVGRQTTSHRSNHRAGSSMASRIRSRCCVRFA